MNEAGIGRVGALAVSLGIGLAVVNTPWLAQADEESAAGSPAGKTSESRPSVRQAAASSESPRRQPRADTSAKAEKSARTSLTAQHSNDDESVPGLPDPNSAAPAARPEARTNGGRGMEAPEISAEHLGHTDRGPSDTRRRPGRADRESVTSRLPQTPTPVDDISGPSAGVDQQGTAPTPVQTPTVVKTPEPQPIPPPKVSAAAPTVAPPVLPARPPTLSGVDLLPPRGKSPTPPAETVPLLAVLAATGTRRQGAKAAPAEQGVETGLMLTAAAQVPVPTVGIPDQTTGAVSGALQGYTVTGSPVRGTVVAIPGAGTYTYTPTTAARLLAGETSGADYDAFAVSMNGQTGAVTVPVLPAVVENQTSIPASPGRLTSPSGIALAGGYAYVTNQGGTTVSVVDTATRKVTKTITVGSQPSAIAINAMSKLAYVTNRGSATVSVINTTTNTVVGAAIRVGAAPQDVTIAGGKVVVANSGTNTISIIDPGAANKVTTVALGTGVTPTALAANGTRAYVTTRTSSGAGGVSVIDTASNTVLKKYSVGSKPQDVAVSASGDRIYVANNGSGSVSVVNTVGNTVATINVGSSPTSLTLSPDGSVLVVARAADNVEVIDTTTNTAIFPLLVADEQAEIGGHVTAFSADGQTMYITDTADHAVRVITLERGNTPPVDGAFAVTDVNTGSGLVMGTVTATDIDGDAVTYTVTTQPTAGGTATVNGTTGAFTYQPTTLARNLAATTAGEDIAAFTVTASDGRSATTVAVSVPIAPNQAPPAQTAPLPGTTITTFAIDSPVAAIGANNRIYVARNVVDDIGESHQSLVVIDQGTRAVVGTVPTGYGYAWYMPAQPAVAASADGRYVYVTNYDYNVTGVVVLDTTTDAVRAIGVNPQPTEEYTEIPYGILDVEVSPADPGRAYVAANDGGLSVVDARLGTVIKAGRMGSWSWGTVDLEASADGRRLYAVSTGGGGVQVIDTTTLDVVDNISVGPPSDDTHLMMSSVNQLEVSPDGKRAYANVAVRVYEPAYGGYTSGEFYSAGGRMWKVTGRYSAISVVDLDPASATYRKEIGSIPFAAAAMVVSKNGRHLYVDRADGRTITVIDTATNGVIGTITTDQGTATGARDLAIATDGKLLITDSADGAVYAVSVL